MKKKILSIAIAAMAFTTFGAVAQTQTSGSNPTCTEQCACPQQGKPDGQKGKAARQPKADPFAGLNLTEAQQAQIKKLQEQRQAQRTEKQKAQKADRQEAKKKYLQDVKSVLTPEQYVTFLENMVVNAPGNKAPKGRQTAKNRAPKGDRKGRAPQAQQTQTHQALSPTVKATGASTTR